MAIIVPGLLLSVADLEVYLHRRFEQADMASATDAVTEAIGLVVQRVGFDPTDAAMAVEPSDIEACRAVAKRVAAQHLTNPEQRQSYSGPDGLSYTGGAQLVGRIMTEADRVVLEMVSLKYAPGFG